MPDTSPAVEETVVPARTSAEIIADIVAKAEREEALEAKGEAKTVEPKAKIDRKSVKLDEEPKTEAEPPAVVSEKARYYLQHGDVAKAIDAAFGDLKEIDGTLPDGVREALGRKLGVNSQQWEKFRKYERATKQQLTAKEQQVAQLVDQVRQDFAPFNQARQAYEAGDYETAFKAAFGEDLVDFQRKAIGQRIGKNPEVEELKAQMARERQERLDEKRALEAQQSTHSEQQELNAYMDNLSTALTESEDPRVVKYAQKPKFVNRVFEIQRDAYDQRTNTTIPIHLAAEQARDEILNAISEWEYSGGSSAQTVQASSEKPEKPTREKSRGRNLSQNRAAEATSSSAHLTQEQRRAKYAKLMEMEID